LRALQFACSLAEESGAHLTVLHVVEWPLDEERLVDAFDDPEIRRAAEERARARLEVLVTDDMRARCRPETQVSYGKPYRRILEALARERADVVVMGVRGRNPLDLAIFGSTTNHVVRLAACPVVTLRE
jgi:nucleotide-binding universal stress UspA family protein